MCKALMRATSFANEPAIGYAYLRRTARRKSVDDPYPNLAHLRNIQGVKKSNLSTAIPQNIGTFLQYTSAQQAANALKGLVDAVEPTAVDAESNYTGKPLYDNNWAKVTNWGSGGGALNIFPSDNVYRFRNRDHTLFFENLFRAVEESIPATCSRNNLFHGHAVFDPGRRDLRIVFHAFEYPADREKTKSGQAKEIEPLVAEFSASDPPQGYYERNAIWSLKSNSLFILDYREFYDDETSPCYPWIDRDGLYVVQTKIGYELVAFNYFPMEEVGLFLKA